ncbi:hypothetical protein [uncultured Clostridium sp.]|uniref:hypothetical protein n=1 Tax=uncultured Clostridium sp. TaxID=59620 RepID=UPI0026F3892D|nr:hypothetical protein [uncultured Clostridium sp.]
METLKKGIGIFNKINYPQATVNEDEINLLLSKNYKIHLNRGTKTAELTCLPLGIVYASTKALDKRNLRQIKEELVDLCALYYEVSAEEFRTQISKDFKIELDYFTKGIEKYFMKSGELIESI